MWILFFSQIHILKSLCQTSLQIAELWNTSEYSVTSWTPIFMYYKRGQTKVGRGKGCDWSI